MGSSATPSELSPEFQAIFTAQADANGSMAFARFMELALYHPQIGYYRANRNRVGYGPNSDFYTASTSGSLFGELVTAACVTLLGSRSPRDFTFVEIGAETPGGILAGITHPFGANRVVYVGEKLEITGPSIVFSNELFDAQPFRRFVFRNGLWRERAVNLADGKLVEVELLRPQEPILLPDGREGYAFDAPYAAAELATKIAEQPWTGLFVACDYGKSFRELIENLPAGTARAYFRHQQSNDLLAQPGEQDLTCHVCWDWIDDALSDSGFQTPTVESQEAFFIHHAARFIAETSAAEAARFSQKKLSLLQLLHPSHLGQKFQVLHAWRD